MGLASTNVATFCPAVPMADQTVPSVDRSTRYPVSVATSVQPRSTSWELTALAANPEGASGGVVPEPAAILFATSVRTLGRSE